MARNQAAALQEALGQMASQRAPAPVDAPTQRTTSQQADRIGKVQVAAYLPRDFRANIRRIQMNEDKSLTDLFSNVFQKH